jgi:hypothetical protein
VLHVNSAYPVEKLFLLGFTLRTSRTETLV